MICKQYSFAVFSSILNFRVNRLDIASSEFVSNFVNINLANFRVQDGHRFLFKNLFCN